MGCNFVKLSLHQKITALLSNRKLNGLDFRVGFPVVSGQKYCLLLQEQKSWDKLLCSGTSWDKITFSKETKSLYQKKQKKEILKQENEVLKQERTF